MNIKVIKSCCRGDEGEACPTCGGAVFEAEKVVDDSEDDNDDDNDEMMRQRRSFIFHRSVFMKSTFERIRIFGCYKDLNDMMLLFIYCLLEMLYDQYISLGCK